MKRSIPFFKMHGSGNDFILIDNRKKYLSEQDNLLIQKICRRRLGIGADGLLLIEAGDSTHFVLRYFNADGKEAAMCANGARCAVYFMHLAYPTQNRFSFDISGRSFQAEITGQRKVKLFWPAWPEIRPSPELTELLTENFRQFILVQSGVPHLVVHTAIPLTELNISEWGAFFRNHRLFGDEGTNVNFVNFSGGKISIRTFERGIEGETLSCGTGAVAAAWAGKHWDYCQWPVTIESRGGLLRVGVDPGNRALWLEGPVQPLYKGVFVRKDFFD